MKRFLILLTTLFCTIVHAETFNQYWYNDDYSLYSQTTCTTGGDISLPITTPTKYGYDFIGWEKLSYTPIEYIESTGTQYIDTGYPSNDIYSIEAIFQPTLNSLWGSIFSGTLDDCTIGYSKDRTNLLYLRYTGAEISKDIPIQADSFNTIKVINGNVTINNSLFTSFERRSCGSSDVNLFIFNNSVQSRPTNIKLKNLKLYDHGHALVRDFTPLIDSNNTPCMYDKVTRQFFYNKGTGQFIAGPVVVAE